MKKLNLQQLIENNRQHLNNNQQVQDRQKQVQNERFKATLIENYIAEPYRKLQAK